MANITKNKNNITLSSHSKRLDKSPAYFSVLKKTNPIVFRFCRLFGKGIYSVGLLLFQNYYQKLLFDVQKISDTFDTQFSFQRWLYEIGAYNSIRSGHSISFIYNTFDSKNSFIRISNIKKLKFIIKSWENDKLQTI